MAMKRVTSKFLREVIDELPAPTIPPITWAEARADYKRGAKVSGPEDAVRYFQKYVGGKTTESFLCMYLDTRNHVLDVVLESEGTVDHTAVYPREILKRALELKAAGILISHNHPGGSLEPSEGDKDLTRRILVAARALGISFHDHLVVAHEGHFSFRQAGLLA
jgi:DNA repair protein RadC